MWIVIFLVVTLCDLVGGYHRFGGKYRLYLRYRSQSTSGPASARGGCAKELYIDVGLCMLRK
jgi:hypothetical protein